MKHGNLKKNLRPHEGGMVAAIVAGVVEEEAVAAAAAVAVEEAVAVAVAVEAQAPAWGRASL